MERDQTQCITVVCEEGILEKVLVWQCTSGASNGVVVAESSLGTTMLMETVIDHGCSSRSAVVV